jgi:hypothetical protein
MTVLRLLPTAHHMMCVPRKASRSRPEPSPSKAAAPSSCWLCGRALGRKVEWHHPWPKSRGGRETVPVHPICHRTIHATFSNAELARMTEDGAPLQTDERIGTFLGWIAGKPPDFHAPTRRGRS